MPLLPSVIRLLAMTYIISLAHTSLTPPPSENATILLERTRRVSIFKQVFISDYLRFHKRNRRDHPRLVYRLCLRQPGLGDRLTGFFHAYMSAVLSQRIFLLDWRQPFNIAHLLLSNSGARFYYDYRDARLEREKSTLHCLEECRPGNLSEFGNRFTVVQNRSQPLLLRDVVRIARNHSNFASAKRLLELLGTSGVDDIGMPAEAEVFGDIFRAVLRPSPHMHAFMQQYAGDLMGSRFVSVHARLGTGVKEGGPRFRIQLTWSELAECLGRRAIAMSKRMGGDGTLFLATDTPAFRQVFRRAVKKVGGKERDVLFGTWGTKHLGRMIKLDEEDLLLFKVAVMECLLLGMGVGMVSTVSRFATVGAFVGGVTERDIIVPQNCR